ncbi:MAG TPA: 4-alpha-glucanotransferase [Dehalococcoidia bacterium]|nr:4-alpha-glucanotransferase [Dehalococcoidia bacterium]
MSERAAGILLHPTSLPGPHGCGDLGDAAYGFVDWLARARQRLWQILPLGPTGFGNSPYATRSAFAGNWLLISLERLRDAGLLENADLDGAPAAQADRADFAAVLPWKQERLRRAFAHFEAGAGAEQRERLQSFAAAQAHWLDDFALFMALRSAHQDQPWSAWPSALRSRDAAALADAERSLASEVAFQRFVQWQFTERWGALKAYANQRGVRVLGDLPIFVALDSADVWAHPELFQLDAAGRPLAVAGVPPDYFSATGQRWGNPLYRWDVLAQTGYAWWIERFRHALTQADLVRIDHFRGFEAYWEVPADEATAVNGRWQPGPGIALFDAVRAALGTTPFVAEDLGVITPEVEALRRAVGAPGMKVLQFAFGDDATNPYLPHNYTANAVVYTGTHDNDTSAGWWAALGEVERDRVRRYLARDGSDLAHDLIRLAYSSVAEMAIAPAQDVLGLGSEARMNLPGRAQDNWAWRLLPGALRDDHAAWLAELADTYGRAPREA